MFISGLRQAGFALQSGDRPELRATTEKMIAEVVAVQEPSGYLNTYYQDDRKSGADADADPDHRATNSTTSDTCCRARSHTTGPPATASCSMPASVLSMIFDA